MARRKAHVGEFVPIELPDIIHNLLVAVGEDPKREGLQDTPTRVTKALQTILSGYNRDPAKEITVFSNDMHCDEIILLRDIEFYSMCEHHLLPFYGKAHVAYIPGEKIAGISKLARLVDIYARRFQIQERICEQVTTTINELLRPKASACVLEAKHLCMMARGVQKQNSVMVTSSMTGAFRDQQSTREELMQLIHKS